MSEILSPAEAHKELVHALNESAAAALRSLLETKHIYQRVKIEVEEDVAAVRSRLAKDLQNHFASVTLGVLSTRFMPTDQELVVEDRGGGRTEALVLLVENVKTFCTHCDDVELLAPVWYRDVTNELAKPILKSRTRGAAVLSSFQLFVLAFQCQRCHGNPEVFVVRRDGWHLVLEAARLWSM